MWGGALLVVAAAALGTLALAAAQPAAPAPAPGLAPLPQALRRWDPQHFEPTFRHWEPQPSGSFPRHWEPHNTRSASRPGNARPRRSSDVSQCDSFNWYSGLTRLYAPKDSASNLYGRNLTCTTTIRANEGELVRLDFREYFEVEEHEKCEYDYLEVRDGEEGYSPLINDKRYCGFKFPEPLVSKGPAMRLRFRSDSTIEYKGFVIDVSYIQDRESKRIPEDCKIVTNETSARGYISMTNATNCAAKTEQKDLEVLWELRVPVGWRIFLNFTHFGLHQPNDCTRNYLEVFSGGHDIENRIKHFCGSMADSVLSTGNNMSVHLFLKHGDIEGTQINATYTAFHDMESGGCKEDEEFDCDDSTCILSALQCDLHADCRLKGDEDCAGSTEEILTQHVIIIIAIFCLILAGMCFVFLFKCIKKLVADHKLIKEHIRASCEARLVHLIPPPPPPPAPHSMPPAPTPPPHADNARNARSERRADATPVSVPAPVPATHVSRHRQTLTPPRSSLSSEREREDPRRLGPAGKAGQAGGAVVHSRDAAVCVPDTRESGCQTRASLAGGSSSGSSGGQGSPATPALTAAPRVELVAVAPAVKPMPAPGATGTRARPHSAVTTRSAPDVIIVSRPTPTPAAKPR